MPFSIKEKFSHKEKSVETSSIVTGSSAELKPTKKSHKFCIKEFFTLPPESDKERATRTEHPPVNQTTHSSKK
jgi:hypothetical protein